MFADFYRKIVPLESLFFIAISNYQLMCDCSIVNKRYEKLDETTTACITCGFVVKREVPHFYNNNSALFRKLVDETKPFSIEQCEIDLLIERIRRATPTHFFNYSMRTRFLEWIEKHKNTGETCSKTISIKHDDNIFDTFFRIFRQPKTLPATHGLHLAKFCKPCKMMYVRYDGELLICHGCFHSIQL